MHYFSLPIMNGLRFKITDDRIDSFFAEFMHGNSKFKCCWEIFKLIFILSHRHASVEGGFSINKKLLTENLEEVSIISQRVMCNHICDLSVTDVPFPNDLLKSCKFYYSRYINALELKKSEKIENEKSQKKKRRIKMDKIADVKKKKHTMESCTENMENGIEQFTFETKKEKFTSN